MPRENQGIQDSVLNYCLILNRLGISFMPPSDCGRFLRAEGKLSQTIGAEGQETIRLGLSDEEEFLLANLLIYAKQAADNGKLIMYEAAAIIQGYLNAEQFPLVPPGNIPTDFHPIVYLLLNPDVLRARADPYTHYSDYGAYEGRRYRL
jgi:hypothetical protein